MGKINISIPKWYDYESTKSGYLCDTLQFQFQNGTIMSLTVALQDGEPHIISIPKWYDYELHISVKTYIDILFQFQNGTIMSLL